MTPSTGAEAGFVETLRSEREIHAAVLRYCRGVDRGDAALTRSAYHPDATDDHGESMERAWDFAERVNVAHDQRWRSTMHVVANHLATVEGDTALAETYVVAYLHRLDGSAVDVVGGRYLDRFEQRSAGWRIAQRSYVCEWSAVAPCAGSLIDAARYRSGARGSDDPSYPWLSGS